MEQLIHLLHTIAEYRSLLEGLEDNRTAAVTGIGQINRSHLIAGFSKRIIRAKGPSTTQ